MKKKSERSKKGPAQMREGTVVSPGGFWFRGLLHSQKEAERRRRFTHQFLQRLAVARAAASPKVVG